MRDTNDDDLDEDEHLDDLHQPELAKQVYAFLTGVFGDEWGSHLPFKGGILEQPYWFWHDMIVLTDAERIAKELQKSSAKL